MVHKVSTNILKQRKERRGEWEKGRVGEGESGRRGEEEKKRGRKGDVGDVIYLFTFVFYLSIALYLMSF